MESLQAQYPLRWDAYEMMAVGLASSELGAVLKSMLNIFAVMDVV